MPVLLNTTHKEVVLYLMSEVVKIPPRGRAEVTERDMDKSEDLEFLIDRGVLRVAMGTQEAIIQTDQDRERKSTRPKAKNATKVGKAATS